MKYCSNCGTQLDDNAAFCANMGSLFKLTYQITLRDARKEKEFIDKLRERNGNLEITCARPGNGNVEI